MKVKIIEDPLIEDIEIHILCKEKNEHVKHIADCIYEAPVTLSGIKDNEYVQLSSEDIYYFESVDNRTFIYCENCVYQSEMKLYELEEELAGTKFIRINKASILNLAKLLRVKGQINGRLLATLSNGEKLIINRSYVPEIKKRLKI